MKAFFAILSAMLMCLSFSACKGQNSNSKEVNQAQIETKNEPLDFTKTLDEIYKDCEIYGVSSATDEDMEEIFGFDLSKIEEYAVRFSSKNYGLADVFIIKPKEEFEQDVFEALLKIKDNRTMEFENYIIYDSLSIAKHAEIYSRGDYLIMIMIKDSENAKEIINSFIDKN